jgi:cell division protein FtsA
VQSKNLFALDLGTTKFCIAALLWRDGNPRLEIVDVPAEGMHRGMVADFSKAERCLKELIEKAEKQMDVLMDRIIVGVAGSHLRSHMAEHVIPLNRQSCHPTHLKRLAEEVEAQAEAPFRELLHCVPISYKIDQREEIDNPLGFSGAHLHGRYFIIDSDKDYLKDVIRICNNNGLEVHRLYSEPFASASVSVDDEAKRLGLAIADIGGGTTDGIVFQNGKPDWGCHWRRPSGSSISGVWPTTHKPRIFVSNWILWQKKSSLSLVLGFTNWALIWQTS